MYIYVMTRHTHVHLIDLNFYASMRKLFYSSLYEAVTISMELQILI